MKTSFTVLAIAGSILTSSFALAKDCSAPIFMAAIQKKCGFEVQYAGKVFGPFQGEVDDAYNVAVKHGSTHKNMLCEIEGGVQCAADTILVKSECP
jgi:hypothetical protein